MFESIIAQLPDVDAAWFAAWLSADGCIGCVVQRREGRRDRAAVSLKFTLTDKDPLDRMAALFGNAVSGPHAPGALGTKETWFWQITGTKAVLLLAHIRPWLSNRYKERADAAISTANSFPKGRKLPPEAVAAIRERLRSPRRGLDAELAREYGVTQTAIWQIKVGRR